MPGHTLVELFMALRRRMVAVEKKSSRGGVASKAISEQIERARQALSSN